MLLAVDVGNTQTVLGLFADDVLAASWRIATDTTVTPDELHVKLDALFGLHGRRWEDISGVAVSSVVPSLTEAWDDVSRVACGTRALVIGPGVKSGLRIAIDNPAELGADRIANAVAAVERFGAPVIVADFGTATTLDVVDGSGTYLGGTISPGIETSAEALFMRAARISKVDLELPARAIGTTTRTSIQAGLMLGEVERVDGLVRRIRDELGMDAFVVATGGLAGRVAGESSTIGTVDENLTLEGIRLIHRRTRG